MNRTYIATAALLLLSGCGGATGATEGSGAVQGEASAGAGAGGSDAGGGWTREYRAPEDILKALWAAGVECRTESASAPTMYSLRSQFCYMSTDRTEGYTASVYGSAEQQGKAQVYLTKQNPGVQYVWGTGWSVSLPFDSDGSEVVGAIGGEVG